MSSHQDQTINSAEITEIKELVKLRSTISREGILVTGGAGFVGSHIAEALLKLGKKVIIYDLFIQETTNSGEKDDNINLLKNTVNIVNEQLKTNSKENTSSNSTLSNLKNTLAELHVVAGDIRDRSHLEKIIENPIYNITSAFHTAGMVDDRRSVIYPDEYLDVNIRGTATLLDVLGKSGKVNRVVQASTRSVFGEVDEPDIVLDESSPRRPVNPYGISKVAADATAHCYSHIHKMQVFLVRITSCYGPRGRPDMILRILMENIESGTPINKFGDGTATRTWLYVDDIVDCFMKAYFYGNNGSQKNNLGLYEEFNTGSKEGAISLNEVIATAERVIGKKANIIHVPVPPKGDARYIGCLNYSKSQSVLGWEPKYNLENGMNALKKYYDNSSDSFKGGAQLNR